MAPEWARSVSWSRSHSGRSWSGTLLVVCHDGAVSTASPIHADPTVDQSLTPDEITFLAKPWVTIVWNDPVARQSGGEGKGVTVRVHSGGSRSIKKQQHT